MTKTTLIIGILIIFTSLCRADKWPSAKVKRYYSQNGQYMLKVTPTFTPEKYWKWRSAKPRRKKRFKSIDTTIIPCHASLIKVSANDTIKIWTQNLINRIAPVEVIVANDGSSIVTFDHWFGKGHGNDVLFVYDQKGGLAKNYKLEDISPFTLNEYRISKLSIDWRKNDSYIDNDRIKICFIKRNKDTKTRILNIKKLKFIPPNEILPNK